MVTSCVVEETLTVSEVAAIYKCDSEYVSDLYKLGILKGINLAKPGARNLNLRFRRSDLETYEEGNRRAGSPPRNSLRRVKSPRPTIEGAITVHPSLLD